VLQEPTWDKINETMKEAKKFIRNNALNLRERTFFMFFYAGHGAMITNQQVLILNGTEEIDRRTKKLAWKYIY